MARIAKPNNCPFDYKRHIYNKLIMNTCQIYQRLSWIREAARMSRPEIAKLCGVSSERWRRLEQGYEPRIGEIRKIAAGIGTDIGWLVTGDTKYLIANPTYLDFTVVNIEPADSPDFEKWFLSIHPKLKF